MQHDKSFVFFRLDSKGSVKPIFFSDTLHSDLSNSLNSVGVVRREANTIGRTHNGRQFAIRLISKQKEHLSGELGEPPHTNYISRCAIIGILPVVTSIFS